MHQYTVGHFCLVGGVVDASAGPAPGERAVEPQAEDITIQTHGYDKCGRINR